MIAWTAERQERAFRAGALTTDARVVSVVGRGPVVRFVTAAGDHVDVTVLARRPSSYTVGQTVRVYYHPDNPSFAGLDDPASRWFVTTASGTLAVMAILLGIYVTRASQRA